MANLSVTSVTAQNIGLGKRYLSKSIRYLPLPHKEMGV